MPMISRGVLDPARRVAEANVAMLAEAVRQGLHDRRHRTLCRAGADARVSDPAPGR